MLGLAAVLAIGSTLIFAIAVALMNSWSFSASAIPEWLAISGVIFCFIAFCLWVVSDWFKLQAERLQEQMGAHPKALADADAAGYRRGAEQAFWDRKGYEFVTARVQVHLNAISHLRGLISEPAKLEEANVKFTRELEEASAAFNAHHRAAIDEAERAGTVYIYRPTPVPIPPKPIVPPKV